MAVKPFHQRMAELYVINKRRPLKPEEMMEMQHCLQANVKYCWEMAYLENMSLIASIAKNVNWQHEICLEIDRIESGQKKKPGRKGTD